ncbi:MAG: cytochrome C oxidase subunit IV family protein, partial [Proteobacteria bacterium]|nr:cytochrome C oxidase subunit IV family protein [Pseudomonadota bacterium]
MTKRSLGWRAYLWPEVAIFGVLLALLAATLGLAYLPLGSLNLAVALLFAVVMAALVALFFMELARARSI